MTDFKILARIRLNINVRLDARISKASSGIRLDEVSFNFIEQQKQAFKPLKNLQLHIISVTKREKHGLCW